MEIAVAGAGYVGLTSAACFSELGHNVRLVEVDPQRVEAIQEGRCPFYEPGLPELLQRHLGRSLTVTDRLQEAVDGAAALFVCVGTPPRRDGGPDLLALTALMRGVRGLEGASGATMVLKSTVPPGTCRMVYELLEGAMPVVSNPEFLREGTAISDFFHPDRIVLGSPDEEAVLKVAGLYHGVGSPLLVTGWEESELIKYATNGFLAAKISFANEIAAVCDGLKIDAADVLRGLGMDQRIGSQFLRPGPGYGGSCLPKDLKGLSWTARQARVQLDLIPAIDRSNTRQRHRLVGKLHAALGGLSGKRVAVWGLAFKAGTDDLRESAALEVVPRLLAQGARVQAHDPVALPGFARFLPADLHPGLALASDPLEALDGADALLVLTEWEDYLAVPAAEIARRMAGRAVVDGRNLLNPEAVRAAGLTYRGVGRS